MPSRVSPDIVNVIEFVAATSITLIEMTQLMRY